MKIKLLVIVILCCVFVCSCANPQLQSTVEQQQESISALESDVTALQGKIKSLQETIETMKKEITGLKDNAQKTSPQYYEGTIQEGN